MIIIWSFSFIIVDIAVEFVPPLSIALYRFIIASISYLLVDIYFSFKKKVNKTDQSPLIEKKEFSKNEWILIIIASFAGVSIFFSIQYTAINLIGPSLPALFVCLLAPLIISILALIFFNEKLSRLKVLGFLIASLGGFLLVTGGNLDTLNPKSPNFLGYALALLTPLLWAIYTTVTKKINKKNSNNTMLKYISYLATIELLIFVILSGELPIFIANFFNILLFLCALYLGIGCFVLGYYIWQVSQEKLKSFKVASFLYIEPFLTLFFSFLLKRNEVIVIWNIMGGIIVLIAVLIINYR
jgi:drug/metabolite transporter (DMT)-like permease